MHLITEKIESLRKKMKELEKNKVLSQIEETLYQLREIIIEENKERKIIGMTEICIECGKSGKVCCGSAIEFKYSNELLLINLILGVNFPNKSQIPDMCFFLSLSGCCLIARDAFCINFICDKIKEKIPVDKMRRLRELEGLHLNLQFQIEQRLKEFISSNGLTAFRNYNK
jgi:ferredoxin